MLIRGSNTFVFGPKDTLPVPRFMDLMRHPAFCSMEQVYGDRATHSMAIFGEEQMAMSDGGCCACSSLTPGHISTIVPSCGLSGCFRGHPDAKLRVLSHPFTMLASLKDLMQPGPESSSWDIYTIMCTLVCQLV